MIIPRIRESIRSGISFEVRVDMRQDLIGWSEKLAKSLNLEFCFGFQFKLDNKGIPKILESNPRVQGTMIASTFAGFNMIYFAIKSALGEKINPKFTINDGVRFIRYWGGVGIHNEKSIDCI